MSSDSGQSEVRQEIDLTVREGIPSEERKDVWSSRCRQPEAGRVTYPIYHQTGLFVPSAWYVHLLVLANAAVVLAVGGLCLLKGVSPLAAIFIALTAGCIVLGIGLSCPFFKGLQEKRQNSDRS